jgi:excisionase family DNA binding protein
MENLLFTAFTHEELKGMIHYAVREAIAPLEQMKATPASEKLLTRKETADKLKISLPTLNDWSKRGMLKSYMIGGRVLYKDSEIDSSLHLVKTVKH